MIRVKICGMRDPLNIREIIEVKPDFLGFIFYPGSPRYVGDKPEMELFRYVPHGIKKVGVFFNEEIQRIIDLSIEAGLDMIQLHGAESPLSCKELKSIGFSIIKSFNIENDFDFESLMPYMKVCDYFLFDTKSDRPGGSGRKFNWEKLVEYSFEKPFFLSGGISFEDTDIIKMISHRGLFGIDLNSRFERAPGIKDSKLVKAFIQEIKNDV
jgi:phosphoribosylanthranilate isomerase